jgi:hypothetical protein
MFIKKNALAVAVSVLLGTTAASVSAATFIDNVESIVITNSANTWLQIGEIQAFNAAGVNVALSPFATATSNIPTAAPYGTSPTLVNDGNINTLYWNPPGIYHSTVETGEALTLTFSAAQSLSSFKIYGRNPVEGGNCCDNRNQFQVFFNKGGGLGTTYQLDARGGSATAQVSAVPEPGEFAMMIAGLGVIAAIARRKNKSN